MNPRSCLFAVAATLMLAGGFVLADAPRDGSTGDASRGSKPNSPAVDVEETRTMRLVDKVGPIKPGEEDPEEKVFLRLKVCTRNPLLVAVLELLDVETTCD